MVASESTLVFTVTRREPELIIPAKSTPHELKPLSDIDDQDGLRFRQPAIMFYRGNGDYGKDPVKVIREALAEALVYYYPWAGRLREGDARKLMVDCTAEGVVFVEAEADVTLDEFGGDTLVPPFPCLEELLYDPIPYSVGVIGCPLLLIQVTRLKCGGFVVALSATHAMTDASGLVQFLNAIAELARGATAPSLLPVWQRELLNARNPPRVTCTLHEYDQLPKSTSTAAPVDDMVFRSFFFGPSEISALRSAVPHHLQSCSTFELLIATLWHCRTIALNLDPNQEARLLFAVNARHKFNPPLPAGYYGNACAFPGAMSTAGEICRNPLGYALELVKKTKANVTEEYMRSMADLMVLRGRPHFTVEQTYLVSDITRIGFAEVDFGWGKPAYGGPAHNGSVPDVASFFVAFKNSQGEGGKLVPISLPAPAMEVFVKELQVLLKGRL
ncbi:Benzyl alcohol O-benzoyltransferase [Ancistrocladus abbreviatus]